MSQARVEDNQQAAVEDDQQQKPKFWTIFKKPLYQLKVAATVGFARTYPFDGHNYSAEIINTDGKTLDLKSYRALTTNATTVDGSSMFIVRRYTLLLAIASFLALPTRLDPKGNFTLIQFLRNIIGGWNPLPRDPRTKKIIWTEKHRWQMLAIPFKFTIIPLLKLIAWPFKLFVNILKLFTEYLPLLIGAVFSMISMEVFSNVMETIFDKKNIKNKWTLFYLIPTLIITGFIYLASATIYGFGQLLTSPVEAAENYYRRLLNTGYSKIWANLAYAFSLIFSFFFLVYAIPLAFGAILTVFPALAQVAASIAQLPVLGNVWTFLTGIVQSLAASAWFAKFTTVLANYATSLSLQVSTTTLMMGFVVAYIATPFIFAANWLTNKLSDLWASAGWHLKTGPLTFLASCLSGGKVKVKVNYRQLLEVNPDEGKVLNQRNTVDNNDSSNPAPRPKAKSLIEETHDLDSDHDQDRKLLAAQQRAEGSGNFEAGSRTDSSSDEQLVVEDKEKQTNINRFDKIN